MKLLYTAQPALLEALKALIYLKRRYLHPRRVVWLVCPLNTLSA